MEEDVQELGDKLAGIVAKLSEQSHKFHKEASKGQTRPSSAQLEDRGLPDEPGRLGLDHVTLCPSDAQPAAESSSSLEEEEESAEDNSDAEADPQGHQRDNLEEASVRMKDRGLETVG